MDKLKQENESLKKQLAELNENTIIQSMNDMKLEFEKKENDIDCLGRNLINLNRRLITIHHMIDTYCGVLETGEEVVFDEPILNLILKLSNGKI